MNSSARSYKTLGYSDFEVWFDHTGWLICAAFKDESKDYILIIEKSHWKQVREQKDKITFLINQGIYYNIVKDIRIIKAGWFAWSNVDFYTVNGLWNGKTDKGFAEFLTTLVPINYGFFNNE